jgi:preprotein translocase subunit SecF
MDATSIRLRTGKVDLLVTAGLFSVLHLDFTLNSVAAQLLLAGYSINDTVVVFDRIRENRRKYKRMKLPELINLSTNQIATRTTLVSVATALTMVPLLIYGGAELKVFSAAILFGILVGTFSSTYVAAALLLYLPAPAGTTSKEATAG